MMPKNNIKIHSDFRLNGFSYSIADLKALAYDLVKEGEPYEQEIGAFLIDWLDDSQIIKVNTSGSTGAPKQIVLQKQQMVNSALATGAFFKLQPKNSALLCLPSAYIAGKMMLVRALVLGLHLDYVAPNSSPLKDIIKSYDFCAIVPLQLEQSLAHINLVKTLLVGGAPVSNTLKAQLQDMTTAVFETYGMTETISHIAVKRINDSSVDNTSNHFLALPNVTLSLDDRDCLVINTPKVAVNMVVTNDMVKLISETEFEWLGRYDTIINSGGVKLFPENIEAKLGAIIQNRFFVAGLPDAKLGQHLVLLIEGEIDAEQLLQKLKRANILERFEVPKKVYVLSEFIKTVTGKIRRTETINQMLE